MGSSWSPLQRQEAEKVAGRSEFRACDELMDEPLWHRWIPKPTGKAIDYSLKRA
jgi:hypothetical protein